MSDVESSSQRSTVEDEPPVKTGLQFERHRSALAFKPFRIYFGGTVLAIGIVMIVAPGPAIVVIPTGLAILGAEFAWAKSWLKRLREGLSSHAAEHRGRRAENHREPHR